MKKSVLGAVFASLLVFSLPSPAAMVSVDLTYSSDDLNHITGTGFVTGNIPNGNTYATVTIDDEGVAGLINFTVTLSPYWSGKEDTSFGIDSFGFNVLPPEGDVGLVTSDIINLPTNWTASVEYTPPNSQGFAQNGFGKFDAVVDTMSQANRVSTLTFSIDNQANGADVIEDYIADSNPGDNGPFLFALKIAGFTDQNPDDPVGTCINAPLDANNPDCNYLTSVWVAGDTITPPAEVPIPAAVWLFGSGLLGLIGIARRKQPT